MTSLRYLFIGLCRRLYWENLCTATARSAIDTSRCEYEHAARELRKCGSRKCSTYNAEKTIRYHAIVSESVSDRL